VGARRQGDYVGHPRNSAVDLFTAVFAERTACHGRSDYGDYFIDTSADVIASLGVRDGPWANRTTPFSGEFSDFACLSPRAHGWLLGLPPAQPLSPWQSRPLMTIDEETSPARPESNLQSDHQLIYRSAELLQGRREIWIEHGEEMYRLRL